MSITKRTTRSTKVGPRTTLVQRTTADGKTSSSFRTRIKNGPNSWITKTMGSRGFTDTLSTTSGGMTRSTSVRNSPSKMTGFKPSKSSNTKSSSKSSGNSGGLGFVFVLIVAFIAWLFSLIFRSK